MIRAFWTVKKMLEIKNLDVTYHSGKNAAEAVRGVSCDIAGGSLSGLVGESGSGKSTMIMAILGLLPKSVKISGEIFFNGKDLLKLDDRSLRAVRWRGISLVPQGAQNSFTPVLTVGRHISEVLDVHLKMRGAAADRRIDQLLEEVGLEAGIKKRYPHELSGGQKQRAAIAAALACSPKLLLADEPTTALDVITQAGILKLLARLRRETGLTIMLVTHDLPLASIVCDDLMVMYRGQIVERGAPGEIIGNPKHEHTKSLVSSAL